MNTPLPQVLSDDLWAAIEPFLPPQADHGAEVHRRAVARSRNPVNRRKTVSTILSALKNRTSWPRTPRSFGGDAAAYRYLEHLKRSGFFAALKDSPLAQHPDLAELPWQLFPSMPCRRTVSPAPEAPPDTPSLASGIPPVPQARSNRDAPMVTVAEDGVPSISSPRMQARILTLHSATDVASFWSATKSILREAVPHDASIAYLDYLDHPKTWKAVKILASANAQMPPEWFEQRWKIDFTPDYVRSHRGITCFRFSDIIRDAEELQRTPYFNQFFKPFGWHYTACVQFWRNDQINSAIALRRTKEQGDFRPAEMEFLKGLQPHIDTVLQRLLPLQTQDAKLRWLADMAQRIPTAVMFMDWSLKPLFVNREALNQCAIWNLGVEAARAYNPTEVFRIPDDFAKVCTDLRTEWVRAHSGLGLRKSADLAATILNPQDPRRMVTIDLVPPHRETVMKPGFRVQFLQAADSRQAVEDPQHSALQWRLTSAERELVQLASLGYNNTEIARRLNKSVNTVKHQFTSIYSKLGENSPRMGFLRRIFRHEEASKRAVDAGRTPVIGPR